MTILTRFLTSSALLFFCFSAYAGDFTYIPNPFTNNRDWVRSDSTNFTDLTVSNSLSIGQDLTVDGTITAGIADLGYGTRIGTTNGATQSYLQIDEFITDAGFHLPFVSGYTYVAPFGLTVPYAFGTNIIALSRNPLLGTSGTIAYVDTTGDGVLSTVSFNESVNDLQIVHEAGDGDIILKGNSDNVDVRVESHSGTGGDLYVENNIIVEGDVTSNGQFVCNDYISGLYNPSLLGLIGAGGVWDIFHLKDDALGGLQEASLQFDVNNSVMALDVAGTDVWSVAGTGGGIYLGGDPSSDYLSVIGFSVNSGGNTGALVYSPVSDSLGTFDMFAVLNSMSASRDLTVDGGTLYVDSGANNVGVGTVSPQAKLEVDGSLSAGSVLYVNDSNKIGIGTTNPNVTLDIKGQQKIFNSAETLVASAGAEWSGTPPYFQGALNAYASNSGIDAFNAYATNHADVFYGYSDSDGDLLKTNNSSGYSFIVTGAGNVGINDTTPDATLDVAGDVLVDSTLTISTGEIYDSTGYIDFGSTSLTTTGTISANHGSKVGNADTYFTTSELDFGGFGKLPMLSAAGTFALGTTIGAIQDYLIIYDQSNNGYPTLAFSANALGGSAAFAFDVANNWISLDKSFMPQSSSSYDLGGAGNIWGHLYTDNITITNGGYIKPSANGVASLDFMKADGTTSVMSIDTNNGRIGIGTATPQNLLDLNANNQPVLSFDGSVGGRISAKVSSAEKWQVDFLSTTLNFFNNTLSDTVLQLQSEGDAILYNNLFVENGKIGIGYDGTVALDAGFQMNHNDGILSMGTLGSGYAGFKDAVTAMMWVPKYGAFRVGRSSGGTAWDSLGNYSFSAGIDGVASGQSSMSLGQSNLVSGNFAAGIGFSNTASAAYSYAIGNDNTSQTNQNTYCFGQSNTSSGGSSMALGFSSTATGLTSMAIGNTATSSHTRSIVISAGTANATSDTTNQLKLSSQYVDIVPTTYARFGDLTNYTRIAPDGEINLVGTARVYKNLFICASANGVGGAAPATKTVNGSGFEILEFADAADDYAQVNINTPSDLDTTADCEIKITWSVPNTSANMTWGYGYSICSENEDTEAAPTTGSTVVTSSATADGKTSDVLFTISGGTLSQGDLIQIYFYRDVSADTYGNPVDVHGMSLKYVSNKLGSAT